MDQIKVQDSQPSVQEKQSLLHSLLDQKLQKSSVSTMDNSNHTFPKGNRTKKVIPNYKFNIASFTIGQNVEYDVQLIEQFKVFGNTVQEVYKFKTRYSKLLMLNQKVKGKGFPKKKIFGNKNIEFLEKRKKELEDYLNGLTKQKSTQFVNFVLQIKQLHAIASLKKPFKLAN